MNPSELIDPDTSWQTKIAAWLVSQGVSTVLLFVIVLGVWHEVPAVVERIDSGYAINSEQLRQAADVYERTTERLLMQMLDDRKLMLEIRRESTEASQQTRSAFEAVLKKNTNEQE